MKALQETKKNYNRVVGAVVLAEKRDTETEVILFGR